MTGNLASVMVAAVVAHAVDCYYVHKAVLSRGAGRRPGQQPSSGSREGGGSS